MKTRQTNIRRSSTFSSRSSIDLLLLLLFLVSAGRSWAAVRYVDAGSTSPAPPFTN